MKNIAPGLPLKKYIGNKHKDGGIMVNALGNKTKDVNKAVAEVEGGEYNFRYDSTNPMNNYIIPAKETREDVNNIAKQANRFKGNNRIDYNTRTNLLNKSMKLNEMLRVQQEQQPMQIVAFGGKLKKYGDGSFLLKGSKSIVDSMVANSKANDTTQVTTAPEIKLGTNLNTKLETKPLELPTLPTTTPKTTAEAANTGIEVNTKNNATPEPTINKKGVKDVTSGLSGIASAFGPIGQAVGAGIQLAPYAIDLGKAMFDKTSVQDLQTQGSAMKLPNKTYAKNGGKLNVVPLPELANGGDTLSVKDINPFEKVIKKEGTVSSGRVDILNPFYRRTEQTVIPSTKVTGTVSSGRVDINNPFNRNNSSTTTGTIPSGRVEGNPFDRRKNPIVKTGVLTNNTGKLETDPFNTGNPLFNKPQITPIVDINNPFNRNRDLVDPFNLNKDKKKSTVTEEKDTPVTTTDNKTKSNTRNSKGNAGSKIKTNTTPTTTSTNMLPSRGLMLPGSSSIVQSAKARFDKDNLEREKEYDSSGISNKELTSDKTNSQKLLDIVEPPKQKDKLSEMLKSGLLLKGSAMAGSLFSALQPAQKETLRLPDFGRADDAMSRATSFSMNPALNEVEQARGKSQEAIRNMATTAGQLTSNLQAVNQRAGQQAAGLRVQEQQIMNQLAAQKAGYETQKASAIQQELARFDENTLMNKAATQEARVAFVENINNLGTEIMKQGNEQNIADEQDKLAVQNAKLKMIQSAFENPDVISGANLEKILEMITKGDYTGIAKLYGQPSNTTKVLKKEEERLAQQK